MSDTGDCGLKAYSQERIINRLQPISRSRDLWPWPEIYSCLLSLTLVMRLPSRSQGLPSQTQTHTWPRSQRSWQRILGKVEELLTQLLLHAIEVNQHISNHGLVVKWLLLHFCISTHPTPNLPEMSPETYPNQKHTRKEIMGKVLKHTMWAQYEAIIPMLQLPQYLCITKLFSRNTFPSAFYLCP